MLLHFADTEKAHSAIRAKALFREISRHAWATIPVKLAGADPRKIRQTSQHGLHSSQPAGQLRTVTRPLCSGPPPGAAASVGNFFANGLAYLDRSAFAKYVAQLRHAGEN